MFVIIGIIVVFGGIIGGYLMEDGNLHVLYQPAEFVIIGGAAIGSFILTCPKKLMFNIIKELKNVFGGKEYTKNDYLTLLSMLFNIFAKAKRDGFISIEQDVETPEQSPLFKNYPEILKNHHAIKFICDNLRVLIMAGGSLNPLVFEDMMNLETDCHHHESEVIASSVTKVGDALPGFGIVAAVMGVVITMGKMTEGPEVIGHSVAAALVGTFIGILLCYGFVGPIGSRLEHIAAEEGKYIEVIKSSLVAFAKEMPPQIAIEYGRRVVPSDIKPSFKELEEAMRKKK